MNVPGLAKVNEKDLPVERFPESNRPPPAVQVWVALSRFVVVTLVPTLMVRLFGLNAKALMLILVPLTAVVPVGADADVGLGLLPAGAPYPPRTPELELPAGLLELPALVAGAPLVVPVEVPAQPASRTATSEPLSRTGLVIMWTP